MTLWILRPIDGLPEDDNPWNPWYDKAFGFVIRAATEEAARAMAQDDAGNEKRGEFLSAKISKTTTPWTDPNYTTCVQLTIDGDEGVVMKDFAAA